MATESVHVEEWTEHTESCEGEDSGCTWCTTTTRYLIIGDLAVRVRERLEAPLDERVYIVERRTQTGYSSWTITGEWLDFAVECGPNTIDFASVDDVGDQASGLAQLLLWLDGAQATS